MRLALLSLARSPGRVVLSIVFFVLSVGVALFAIAYRATLERGESEQARYAVPAPYVLQESLEQLVTRAGGGVGGADTRRSAGRHAAAPRLGLRARADAGRDFTLLALPAAELHAPRTAGARTSPRRRPPSSPGSIAPAQHPRLRGVALPPDARQLTVPLDVAGDPLGVALVVLNRRGDFSTLSLGQLGRGAHAPTVVAAAAPRAAAGSSRSACRSR